MSTSADSPPDTPKADAISGLIRRTGGRWRPIRDGGFIGFMARDFSEGPLDQIPATDAVYFKLTPVNDDFVFSHRNKEGNLVRMSSSVVRFRVFEEEPNSGEHVEREYFVDEMNLFFDTAPPETTVLDPSPVSSWHDVPTAASSPSSRAKWIVAAMTSTIMKAEAAAARDDVTTTPTATQPTTPTAAAAARNTTADVSPGQLRRVVTRTSETRQAYYVREGRRRRRGLEGIAESSSEAYHRPQQRRIAEKRAREGRRNEATDASAAAAAATRQTPTAAGPTTRAARARAGRT